MTNKSLARCMGGRHCNHTPGTCTATNAEYQARAKAQIEGHTPLAVQADALVETFIKANPGPLVASYAAVAAAHAAGVAVGLGAAIDACSRAECRNPEDLRTAIATEICRTGDTLKRVQCKDDDQ